LRKKSVGRASKNASISFRNGGAPQWDNRFNITCSKGNHYFHDYYREYFGKQPKRFASSFRIKYANSTNELPGITDVGSTYHCKVKEFKSLP